MFARQLCRDIVPYEDGPAPVDYRHWHFLLAGALVGAGASLHAWQPAQIAAATLIVIALATCAACDLQCGMLPDIGAFAVIGVSIVFAAVHRDGTPALSAACIAVPFAGLALLTRGRGMGWGDVKLVAAGGAVLGIGGAVVACSAAAFVAYVIARRGAAPQRPIPFGAYLAGAIALGFAVIR